MNPSLPHRDALGGIVLTTIVQEPEGRQHFERQFFPGVEVGLAGWDRAHSQGNMLGNESPFAIRYAPAEVNRVFQLDIERFIRKLFLSKTADVELLLTTVTYTHPGTLRLKEIIYRLDAQRNTTRSRLWEASLEVENKRFAPRVWLSVHFVRPDFDWGTLR